MLIVLIAKKKKEFRFWIRFNYSRIVYYSELLVPSGEGNFSAAATRALARKHAAF